MKVKLPGGKVLGVFCGVKWGAPEPMNAIAFQSLEDSYKSTGWRQSDELKGTTVKVYDLVAKLLLSRYTPLIRLGRWLLREGYNPTIAIAVGPASEVEKLEEYRHRSAGMVQWYGTVIYAPQNTTPTKRTYG